MKEVQAAQASAKAEEEKKENEDIFAEGELLKNQDQNGSGEEAFDDTLENLMTIDESGEGSMMSQKQGDDN